MHPVVQVSTRPATPTRRSWIPAHPCKLPPLSIPGAYCGAGIHEASPDYSQQVDPHQQAHHLTKTPRPASRTFFFRQPVPIATYLLALAVGQLESRELGPISRVWSEPGVVDAAAYEFAETAKFLEAGAAGWTATWFQGRRAL